MIKIDILQCFQSQSHFVRHFTPCFVYVVLDKQWLNYMWFLAIWRM